MDNPKNNILQAFRLLALKAGQAFYHLGIDIDNVRYERAERNARKAVQSTDPATLAKAFNSFSDSSRIQFRNRTPSLDGARSSIDLELALRSEALAEPTRLAILTLQKPAAVALAARCLVSAFEELHSFTQGHGSIRREFDTSPLPKHPEIAEARLALLAPCFTSISHVWRPVAQSGWAQHSESIISEVANFLRVVDAKASGEHYTRVPAFEHAMAHALSQSPLPFLDAISQHFSTWNGSVPPSSILLRARSMMQAREIESASAQSSSTRKATSRI
jgi:hypothetical protein